MCHKKIRLQIQDMHCIGCAMTIDDALEDLPGMKSASTNYAQQTAEVEYNDRQLTETQLIDTIR